MRIALFLILAALSGMIQAKSSLPLSSVAGLWQFGDHAVWIRVNPDGSALQCRIAPGGTVYTSRGIFVSPDAIRWQTIWGVDQISLENDAMTLHGKWGDFVYHRAEISMSYACTPAPIASN
jgi:hypothetical protein